MEAQKSHRRYRHKKALSFHRNCYEVFHIWTSEGQAEGHKFVSPLVYFSKHPNTAKRPLLKTEVRAFRILIHNDILAYM